MYFVCFIFLRETLEDLNKNQKKLKKFELDVEKFQQDLSKVIHFLNFMFLEFILI